jgi:glutamate-1-semialdehyde aminotransferase
MEAIENGLRAACKKNGIPFSSRRMGSLMNVWFSDELPPSNHVRTDEALASSFHLSCMANGIFGVPRTLMNISTATSDADVKEIIERLDSVVADMAAEA